MERMGGTDEVSVALTDKGVVITGAGTIRQNYAAETDIPSRLVQEGMELRIGNVPHIRIAGNWVSSRELPILDSSGSDEDKGLLGNDVGAFVLKPVLTPANNYIVVPVRNPASNVIDIPTSGDDDRLNFHFIKFTVDEGGTSPGQYITVDHHTEMFGESDRSNVRLAGNDRGVWDVSAGTYTLEDPNSHFLFCTLHGRKVSTEE